MSEKIITQNWVKEILENKEAFCRKFVVHTDERVLFAALNIRDSEAFLKENQPFFEEELMLFLVPHNFGTIRLRMLKIKSLSAGEWMPTFPVDFFMPNGALLRLEMLVDSGADVSFIPLHIGERLGFSKSHGESVLYASGVGSKVPYLVRENRVKIGQTEIDLQFLWGQDAQIEDMLLGRFGVFDHFDITFSFHRKQLIFAPAANV